MKYISQLPRHRRDVYVIGSGKSMDYIDPSFFKGKISIGINLTYKKFPVTYGIAHHHEIVQQMIDDGVTTVTSEFDMGLYGNRRHNFRGEYFVYHHNQQEWTKVVYKNFRKKDWLLMSGTTISAIHLAYKLGAKTIILCGIDAGSLDGIYQYEDYPVKGSKERNKRHVEGMQPVIDHLCKVIRDRGVNVYSLNPFNNFRLENHKFRK